ncbi:MAG: MFS transporter [Phycisphaerales bacterium JB041]
MSPVANRSRLFAASCIALIVTAMSFAIRGDIMGDLETLFELSKEQMGWIAGTAFWGFTLAMVVGGPLCDVLGMKRLVFFAFVGHAAGILLTIFANGFGMLYAGTLAIGIANGFVEAACNPLIATVFPDNKTHKLNQFHVWFPGGIVIGGLAAFAISGMNLGDAAWQVKMGTMLLPMLVYGGLFFGQPFPVTERVASGVSMRSMFAECLRPLFIVMVLCMFLTASSELGPGQWIPNILTFSAGVSGILVLVWINGLMAMGRQFAGPVVHRLKPSGMLFFSAILAAIGLFLLSRATGAVPTFAAATVFAAGVCYFWPTMLGFVAERMPKTGALGLSILGGAGMLAVSFVLPLMGKLYDTKIDEAIPEGYSRELISAPDADAASVSIWNQVQAEGGAATLAFVAGLPLVLIVVFGVIFFTDRAKGGYKAEKLAQAPQGGVETEPSDGG